MRAQKKLPAPLRSLAERIHQNMEAVYQPYRQAEREDFQKVEKAISSLLESEINSPEALVPIIKSAEKSYARHFELGIALEENSMQLTQALEARVREIKEQISSPSQTNKIPSHLVEEEDTLNKFLDYWQNIRDLHTRRIFCWLNSRTHQWNYAFGFQSLLPKITELSSLLGPFSKWRRTEDATAQNNSFFTPSEGTERLGTVIHHIGTAILWFPKEIADDISALTAAAKKKLKEKFNWATVSGVLLAGLGFIPRVGPQAKTLGKVAKWIGEKGILLVAEKMSRRAAKYQTKITGLPSGHVYEFTIKVIVTPP